MSETENECLRGLRHLESERSGLSCRALRRYHGAALAR
jgi:hypothetical protein